MDDDDGADVAEGGPARAVVLVVDVANAVGSRPDGWWRDRAGASTRLLAQLGLLACAGAVVGPGGEPLAVTAVHAVLEGRARSAVAPAGVDVVLAVADGDTAVADLAAALAAAGAAVLVVTADRGLRARLPQDARAAGPGWLRDRLDALAAERE